MQMLRVDLAPVAGPALPCPLPCHSAMAHGHVPLSNHTVRHISCGAQPCCPTLLRRRLAETVICQTRVITQAINCCRHLGLLLLLRADCNIVLQSAVSSSRARVLQARQAKCATRRCSTALPSLAAASKLYGLCSCSTLPETCTAAVQPCSFGQVHGAAVPSLVRRGISATATYLVSRLPRVF